MMRDDSQIDFALMESVTWGSKEEGFVDLENQRERSWMQ